MTGDQSLIYGQLKLFWLLWCQQRGIKNIFKLFNKMEVVL